MNLLIEKETDDSFDFDYEEAAKSIIEQALDYLKCPYEVQLNLTLTDNEGIHAINKEYRQIDRPTDVLSFPLVDYPEPNVFPDNLEEMAEDYFDLDTGELMLGDIIISVEKCKEQAKEYGHSELREYSFLIVHSMLHLFGYDHMEDDERLVMEEKQREILDKAGILR
ncbi:MAG: rRNA maturation RNase YbeY [Lachnospiraceae bacterium]|nr:rRNA maturation RNase YbeY [Lachnospiraceae bacterium]MCR5203657.1 rRNA maturation RNase YbeY [Lachnospiraceae bacterium]